MGEILSVESDGSKARHKREFTSVGQVNSGNCSSSDLTGHEFNAFSRSRYPSVSNQQHFKDCIST